MNTIRSYLIPNQTYETTNTFINGSFGKIFYQKYGSGPKFIICLHSFSGNSKEFEAIGKNLANKNYHVICPNFYGRGGSDVVDMKYNFNLFCSQINDIMLYHKCIFPIILIGFSMGGMIAHYFAKKYPNRVKNLFLIAPTGQNTAIPLYLDYYVFYPLGEIIAAIAAKFFLIQHQKNTGGENIIIYNNGYIKSLLYTLRGMPWNDYLFQDTKCKTYLIYSENDRLVKINPDKIQHNKSFVFSEYSHMDLLKSKIGDIIFNILNTS